MAGKTALVLGLGTGGLVAANELRQRLPSGDRVVAVDRRRQYVYQPAFLRAMLGQIEPPRFTRDLGVLRRKGIEVLQAEVHALDPQARVAETSAGAIGYDCAVVALGADLDPGGIPGLAAVGFNLYDLDGVLRLREAARRFPGGRVAVLIAGTPYKCPPAPYEAALLLDDLFRRRRMRRRVEIDVFTPEPAPLAPASPGLGTEVARFLERRGIGLFPGLEVLAVDPARRRLLFTSGRQEGFDLLVAVPPHRGPAALGGSPLAGAGGWVPVHPETLAAPFENLFCVGDAASIPLPSGTTLPKAGVFSHFQARVAARNAAALLAGRGGQEKYGGAGYCLMDVGRGRAAPAGGNYYALPRPRVFLLPPTRLGRWAKVGFERWWLRHWF